MESMVIAECKNNGIAEGKNNGIACLVLQLFYIMVGLAGKTMSC